MICIAPLTGTLEALPAPVGAAVPAIAAVEADATSLLAGLSLAAVTWLDDDAAAATTAAAAAWLCPSTCRRCCLLLLRSLLDRVPSWQRHLELLLCCLPPASSSSPASAAAESASSV